MRSSQKIRALAKPPAAPKKRNVKRHAANLERAYGPKERREFVKTLPCAACGRVGSSVSAHLLGNGGMSRKKPANTTGPLCSAPCTLFSAKRKAIIVRGDHDLFDNYPWIFRRLYPDFNPERVAAETAERFQQFINGD